MSTRDAAAEEPLPTWLTGMAGVFRWRCRIWATVELERALAEFGLDSASTAAAVDDPLLGARVVVIPSRSDGDLDWALAEPATEGRLAATLARHGEGPAGRYVGVAVDLDEIRKLAGAAGIAISRRAFGPFGPEVVVLGGSLGERNIVLVAAPALPSPP